MEMGMRGKTVFLFGCSLVFGAMGGYLAALYALSPPYIFLGSKGALRVLGRDGPVMAISEDGNGRQTSIVDNDGRNALTFRSDQQATVLDIRREGLLSHKFSSHSDYGPLMQVFNAEGNIQFGYAQQGDQPTIYMFGETVGDGDVVGMPTVALGHRSFASSGSPHMVLTSHENGELYVGINQDGVPVIRLVDKDSGAKIEIGVGRGGVPYIYAQRGDGSIVWNMPQLP